MITQKVKGLLAFLFLITLCITVVSQENGWSISTTNQQNYTGIVAANGRIGILPSSNIFKTKQIILNNVYDKASPLGVSRILQGMNFGNLEVEINGQQLDNSVIDNWKQTLHMKEARFTTSFTYKNLATISYSIYALQNVPYAGYIDVEIQASEL